MSYARSHFDNILILLTNAVIGHFNNRYTLNNFIGFFSNILLQLKKLLMIVDLHLVNVLSMSLLVNELRIDLEKIYCNHCKSL